MYGDITGDDLPDVAVGRIPANTLSEANDAVNKIITYDESVRLQAWQRQVIFIADRIDPAAGDFWHLSDDIILGYTPPDQIAQRIYLGSTEVPTATAARTAIADAINAGAFMVQFTGHGAPQWWSKEKFWRVADVPQLTNTTMLPVIMSFNCMDGFFIYSSSAYQGLAETMVRYSTGGSVAAIAPSGEGLASDQSAFRKILMDTMFKDGVQELGRGLLVAKKYVQSYGMNYYTYEMNLFGDPALRLPIGNFPKAPVVTAARSDTSSTAVSLVWPAVTETGARRPRHHGNDVRNLAQHPAILRSQHDRLQLRQGCGDGRSELGRRRLGGADHAAHRGCGS